MSQIIDMSHFTFKKLTEKDLPLLLTWFKEPHVGKWWPTPEKDELLEKFLQRIRSKDTFGYLVFLGDVPIGYIQYYYIDRNNKKAGSWLPPLPETTIGTDQFIGDPRYVGKGYGTLFIKQFIHELKKIEPTVTTVIVDPNPENAAAIRCYEKVGFMRVGIYDVPGDRHLLMLYDKGTLMPVLTVNNLTKIFTSGFWPFKKLQTYTAVDNISFQLKKGEILGFLGPNGAGKTTTIQMLLGTLTPTSGMITYFGNDFAQHRVAALKKIGYASGYDKLPARLTITENLDIVGRIYGLKQSYRGQQIEKLLKSFGIWQLRDRQTGTLSAGQATRVMLAKAFISDPEVVLLDEPTASLDPDVAHEVRQFILAQRNERGTSILITSHNMDEVTELCDRVLVLKNGTIIADNTPELLARSTSKVRVHLTISSDVEQALTYLHGAQLTYTAQGNHVTIELDEHAIARLLAHLAEHKIIYSHISIDKPTLEDYFLSIAK